MALRNVPRVRKASRAVLYLVGGILLSLAALLLAVNLYVQSRGTQARIEDELSRRLGTQLRIDRISVTPWWGLKLRGITIPQADATIAKDFLKADTFRLRIRFLSLFARELVIKEVSLINPTVFWAQNEAGKWRIPASLPPTPNETQTSSSAPAPPSEPLPVETERAAPAASDPASAETQSPFTPEVRRVNLANGNFHFLDAKGRRVASFEGFGFRSSLRNSTALRGTAKVSKISLRDRFFLQELNSPVKYDPDELEFSQIKATSAGGEITGRFSMRQTEPGSPFQAKVTFRNLQADQLVAAAGGPSGMVQGRLEGTLQANGKTSDPNALAGTGEIHLRDGQLRQYSLLVALGQVLQIDELAQLRFEDAHVKYHITPGVVMIDELLLSSPNIRVASRGKINFDGKVRLESQLAINDRIRNQLFRAMRESFHPTDEPGFAAVDFKVTGTVERPKTDLMGKLVGRDLKDIGGVISSLLGGSKEKKKPRSEASAPPAAEPSVERMEAAGEAAGPTEPAPAPTP